MKELKLTCRTAAAATALVVNVERTGEVADEGRQQDNVTCRLRNVGVGGLSGVSA